MDNEQAAANPVKTLIAAIKAVQALPPVPSGARMHAFTLATLKGADDPPAIRYPWESSYLGTPVYVDNDVPLGEVEWDYPDAAATDG